MNGRSDQASHSESRISPCVNSVREWSSLTSALEERSELIQSQCEIWHAAFMAGERFISSSDDPSHLNRFLDETARIYNKMLRIQIPLQKRAQLRSYLRAQSCTGEAIRRILECAEELYDASAEEHGAFIVDSLIKGGILERASLERVDSIPSVLPALIRDSNTGRVLNASLHGQVYPPHAENMDNSFSVRDGASLALDERCTLPRSEIWQRRGLRSRRIARQRSVPTRDRLLSSMGPESRERDLIYEATCMLLPLCRANIAMRNVSTDQLDAGNEVGETPEYRTICNSRVDSLAGACVTKKGYALHEAVAIPLSAVIIRNGAVRNRTSKLVSVCISRSQNTSLVACCSCRMQIRSDRGLCLHAATALHAVQQMTQVLSFLITSFDEIVPTAEVIQQDETDFLDCNHVCVPIHSTSSQCFSSSIFSTYVVLSQMGSSPVTFTRLRDGRDLLQCHSCRGTIPKRGVCVHEKSTAGSIMALRSIQDPMRENSVTSDEDTGDRDDEEYESSGNAWPHPTVSKRGRRLIPCRSDLRAYALLSEAVIRYEREGERGACILLRDVRPYCFSCELHIPQSISPFLDSCDCGLSSAVRVLLPGDINRLQTQFDRDRLRPSNLYMLWRARVPVLVADTVCSSCRAVVPFDGLECGVVVTGPESVYCREILDYMSHQIFMNGSTIRDSISSYLFAMSAIETGIMRGYGASKLQVAGRRAISEALACLVSAFRDPEGQLGALFKCDSCEVPSSEPSLKRLRGIVLDGTCIGLLLYRHRCAPKIVPAFRSSKMNVPGLKPAISALQYLLPSAHAREGARALGNACIQKSLIEEWDNEINIQWHGSKITQGKRKLAVLSLLMGIKEAGFSNAERSLRNLLRHVVRVEVVSGGEDDSGEGGVQGNELHRLISEQSIANTEEDLRRIINQVVFVRAMPERFRRLHQALARIIIWSCDSLAPSLSKLTRALQVIRLGRKIIGASELAFSPSDPAAFGQDVPEGDRTLIFSRIMRDAEEVSEFCPGIVEAVAAMDEVASRGNESIAVDECAMALGTVITELGCQAAVYLRAYEASRSEESRLFEFNATSPDEMDEFEQAASRQIPGGKDPFLYGQAFGSFFPGRIPCRPSVKFSTRSKRSSEDVQYCNKRYETTRTHSPGLIVAACCCEKPKILGISVLTEPESVSTAVSVVLSHFRILPASVIYDNACNMASSLATRAMWIFHRTKFVLDRFHGSAHTCGPTFHANEYPSLDPIKTASCESVNSLLGMNKPSIRYLRDANLVPFVLARAAFLNLKAQFRERTGIVDVEGHWIQMRDLFNSLVPCLCTRCASIEETGCSECSRSYVDAE
jgi:hypothetical protein